ncbi:hypothetical protein SMSP2_02684 [Limihaloglobus sulfuriphilus]|uniref:Uncharacterized protein n=1 Tax=Limihaloglobus sulfuriphilus TaxID=1851148 RepID=A0A1Q2MHY2_9BACT|nr:hypothetical protein [Limihaloglobus sulfuriphilus]AQQ72301.1 hypothetical protein SMSP2_02684 [Limihaloglobus sulfuriphilus]
MKFFATLVFFVLFTTSLPAAITITAGDIQQDDDGYYYEYELTYGDMANSNKLLNDAYSHSNISVIAPAIMRSDRYIVADAGETSAAIVYEFDFTSVIVDGLILTIKSVDIRDTVTMFNNASGNETSTVATKWSVNNSSYTTLRSVSTPASGSTTSPFTTLEILTGQDQKFYYRVSFSNSKYDANGFDAGLNQWNRQGNTSSDHFKVTVRFTGTAPAGTYGGGYGTDASPYLIETPAQLNAMNSYPIDWDKSFKLAADIDMSGYKY